MIRKLVISLSKPSAKNQTPEQALIRGLAHVVAGAALVMLLPAWLVIVGYFLLKEALLDYAIRRGDPVDCGMDTMFVALGTTTAYFSGWPFAAIGLGLIHGWIIWLDG